MRPLIITCILAASINSIWAQYKIDLNKIEPVSLKYLQLGNPGPAGKEIRINNMYMDEGGIPKLPVMGEFHYSRMQPD